MQAQWQIQLAPTTADLRGIYAVSPQDGVQIAWASGTNGTVLRTLNGGQDWHPCAIPPAAEHLDFRGIQAFDANTAIVMSSGKGDLSRLYKTTDGCQSWTLLFTNPDPEGFWDSLSFDKQTARLPWSDRTVKAHGVLLGDPVNGAFVIYQTSDSGTTWHAWGPAKIWKPASSRAGESIFAASNSSMIVPTFSAPFEFVTGGAAGSWLFTPKEHSPLDAFYWWAFSTKRLPFARGRSSGAFSLATDGRDLMIVGGDYSKPDQAGQSALIPAFTGLDAVVKPSSPPHGYRSAVAYDPTTRSWITVGPNGTDISTDDGRNWRALKPSLTDAPDADRDWNALSLPFVVGPHGRIGILRPTALAPPGSNASKPNGSRP